jgi:hypothetical protein
MALPRGSGLGAMGAYEERFAILVNCFIRVDYRET